MRRTVPVVLAAVLLVLPAAAQVRQVEMAAHGTVNVVYTHPDDQGYAERLRNMVYRVKASAEALYPLDEVTVTLVHTRRELELQLGPQGEGQVAGASYVRGILYLSPASWPTNPTDEALSARLEEALVRYALLQVSGGNRVPGWLEEGLVAYLTKQEFPPTSAELVANRAEVLLGRWETPETEVGYWAVRYLLENHGGLENMQRLLRMTAQRPDSFFGNLELTFNRPLGEMERGWRGWLVTYAEDQRREGGVRTGPIVRPPPQK